MKKILIFFEIIICIVFLAYAALFVFINLKGKGIALAHIKQNLGLEASLDSLRFSFPFNLEIKNLKCAGLSFRKANVSFGLPNPFNFRVILNKVIIDGFDIAAAIRGNKVDITSFPALASKAGISSKIKTTAAFKTSAAIKLKEKYGAVNLEETKSLSPATSLFAKLKAKTGEKKLPFVVRDFRLRSSRAKLAYVKDAKPIIVALDDMELRLEDFSYPELSKFYVELRASLSPTEGGREITNTLGVGGWVDYANKSMSLNLDVDNFDYIVFGDCYPSFWKPDNLYLKQALLSLKSKLTSENNDLDIDCSLFLDKVEFIDLEEGAEGESRVKTLKTIIALFKANKDKPTLHFKLKTKMDSPKLDFSSLKGMFSQFNLFNPVAIVEDVIDKVKGQAEDTGEATVDTVVDTIKSIVDVFKGAF